VPEAKPYDGNCLALLKDVARGVPNCPPLHFIQATSLPPVSFLLAPPVVLERDVFLIDTTGQSIYKTDYLLTYHFRGVKRTRSNISSPVAVFYNSLNCLSSHPF
jgi:hypothetical protein